MTFDPLTLKSIEFLNGSWSTHVWSITIVCQKVIELWRAEMMQASKYKFDLDLWLIHTKIIRVLYVVLGNLWSIIIVGQKKVGLSCENHFFHRQTDNHDETTSIPPHNFFDGGIILSEC